MQANLEKSVQTVGVPQEQVEDALAELAVELQGVQERVEQANPSFSEARGLTLAVGNAQMDVQRKVQEMRARYQPKDLPAAQEIHLRWQELAGAARIASSDEMEQVLTRLRAGIAPELERQKIVIIE